MQILKMKCLSKKAFEEMAVGKTVIMIAHRLTTVKNAEYDLCI